MFTKAELLRDVWDYRAPARTRTLDSHASRLRRKLREARSRRTPWSRTCGAWATGCSERAHERALGRRMALPCVCSTMCAVQPITRLTANVGVNNARGNPIASSTTDA